MNKEIEMINDIIENYSNLSLALSTLQQIRKNEGRKTSKQIAEEIGIDHRLISSVFNPNLKLVTLVLQAMSDEAKGVGHPISRPPQQSGGIKKG